MASRTAALAPLLLLVLVWTLAVEAGPGGHQCVSYAEMYFANVAGKIKGGVDILTMGDQTLCSKRTFVDRRYRQIDGRCNHRRDYGSTFKPVKRYLRPHYQDRYGYNTPRIYSAYDGSYLPSPRLVSWKIHPDKSGTDNHTMLIMQMGQLVDHDITSAPVPTETNSSIKCCGVPYKDIPSECFPIPIPRDDPHFPETCMEFVRSEPAHDTKGRIIYPREQLNVLTSFIDGSAFYGNDEESNAELRTRGGRGALLKTRLVNHQERLPVNEESECLKTKKNPDSYCQLAGDKRVNEQPFLGSIHTLFHLYHNLIVRTLVRGILGQRGPAPSDRQVEEFIEGAPDYTQNKLYEEAKKIHNGIFQKIVYCDWLPIILGPRLTRKFKLGCERRSKYNPYVDPRIANSFLSAAFRFGHTLIPNHLKINKRQTELRTQFMVPDNSIFYYDSNLEGMIAKGSQGVYDRFVSSSVSNHLFEPANGKKGSLDLIALNIQRGRDHGIPAYYHWRRYYGLKRISSFRSMGEMGPELAKLYRHILDIDLFPAGLLEHSVPGGIVGPTFGHIIAHQFADLKFGDSHFFLSKESPQGFTEDQIAEIKRVSMSHIICQCSKVAKVQQDPFYEHSDKNPLRQCSSFPALDVTPWLIYW